MIWALSVRLTSTSLSFCLFFCSNKSHWVRQALSLSLLPRHVLVYSVKQLPHSLIEVLNFSINKLHNWDFVVSRQDNCPDVPPLPAPTTHNVLKFHQITQGKTSALQKIWLFCQRIKWEGWFYSHICVLNMKLKPAAGWVSLAQRLETGGNSSLVLPHMPGRYVSDLFLTINFLESPLVAWQQSCEVRGQAASKCILNSLFTFYGFL